MSSMTQSIAKAVIIALTDGPATMDEIRSIVAQYLGEEIDRQELREVINSFVETDRVFVELVYSLTPPIDIIWPDKSKA